MKQVDIIFKYFNTLTEQQKIQFKKIGPLYTNWNKKLNLISRKCIDQLYVHHVLHSLSIAKIIDFSTDTKIIDVGTGGGFPGIPLAILFPQAKFYLIDTIGKKIKAVQAIAKDLQLHNVYTQQIRIENVQQKYDFILGRAVTAFPIFYDWVKHLFLTNSVHKLKNGILYLKGGYFLDGLSALPMAYRIYDISDFF